MSHALKISPRTVEIDRARMMHKLGMGILAEAVRLCIAVVLGYQERGSDGIDQLGEISIVVKDQDALLSANRTVS